MTPNINTIKEIAQDVYETLGSGFSEEVYDRAMQVGLRLAKIGYEGQKVVELKYKDRKCQSKHMADRLNPQPA